MTAGAHNYVIDGVGTFNGDKVIEEFDVCTKDAERVQMEILKKILEANSEVEYLQRFGLNGRTDPVSFKECVPLSHEDDYGKYMERIVNGDSSPILLGKPILGLSLSSGTTKGKMKYIPFTNELLESILDMYYTSFAYGNNVSKLLKFIPYFTCILCRAFPIDDGKTLQFIYVGKSKSSNSLAGGLQLATITTFLFSSSCYMNCIDATNTHYCTPRDVISGPDPEQTLYCHLLCSLLFREEIQYVFASFSHTIIHAFNTFKQVWEEMCDVIRTGVLPDKIADPCVRSAMLNLIKRPDVDLADMIRKECSALACGDWYGLIPKLFPNIKYVYGVLTGSMEPYMDKLRHYAGNVPLVAVNYGCTECMVAVNVNPTLTPEAQTFVVHPKVGYFEFIPHGENITDKTPVGLTEVKVGEEYELVATTFTGMYRYQVGDVVKIIGFHNKSPEIRFLRKTGLLLNIHIDKTTETDMYRAVRVASECLTNANLQLVDFTSQADLSTDPAHYVIFWELSDDEASDDLVQECCNALDKNISGIGYVISREPKTIGPLELRVVRKGTFRKILEHFVSMGTSINQYKQARCIAPSNKKMVEILSEGVLKFAFSTAYD